MCFMLYAATNMPFPRKEWDRNVLDLSVTSLDGRDAEIRNHFTLPEVQNIGSTSCCGCDFPHATLMSGLWDGYVDEEEEAESARFNREALVKLLAGSGEQIVELYGIWWSDGREPTLPENFREEIPLARILEPTFRFKERGFYRVTCGKTSLAEPRSMLGL